MRKAKTPKDITTIQLNRETQVLLSSLMRHGQTYDEFVQALLDKCDSHAGTIVSGNTVQRLQRYRKSDKDTLDDLVKNALNENQDFEKQIVKQEAKK